MSGRASFLSQATCLFVISAALLLPAAATAEQKRVAVIEAKVKGIKIEGLSRGLGAALKVNHGYVNVAQAELYKQGKSLGLSLDKNLTPAQLVQVGQKANVKLLVLVRPKLDGKQYSVDMRVMSTDTRGVVWSQNYLLKKAKLDRVTATDMARDVRAGDAGGTAQKASAGEDMEFSLEDAPLEDAKKKPAADAGLDFSSDGDTATIDVGAAKKQAEEAREAVAAESGEEDDEFYEPTEVDENVVQPRYVPPDGRSGLVASAGLLMVNRVSLMGSTNGTPPRYQGVLSPGIALNVQVFPRRFKDGGGMLREFGVYAGGGYAFMPSAYIRNGVARNFTDQYLSVQGGLIYRHVFGYQEKSISVGARASFQFEQTSLGSDLPFPSTTYYAPYLAGEGEVPVIGKYLVFSAQAGVMPVAGVGAASTRAFGRYKYAWGLGGRVAASSTINDTLYLEAAGFVRAYMQYYGEPAGSSDFRNVEFTDLYAGMTISAGVAY